MQAYTEREKQPLESKGVKKEERKLAYCKQATPGKVGKGHVTLKHSNSNEGLISKQLNQRSKSQSSPGFTKESSSSMIDMMNMEHLLQKVSLLSF